MGSLATITGITGTGFGFGLITTGSTFFGLTTTIGGATTGFGFGLGLGGV